MHKRLFGERSGHMIAAGIGFPLIAAVVIFLGSVAADSVRSDLNRQIGRPMAVLLLSNSMASATQVVSQQVNREAKGDSEVGTKKVATLDK